MGWSYILDSEFDGYINRIASQKEEIESLKAQLAACLVEDDREPIPSVKQLMEAAPSIPLKTCNCLVGAKQEGPPPKDGRTVLARFDEGGEIVLTEWSVDGGKWSCFIPEAHMEATDPVWWAPLNWDAINGKETT